jgi:signal transduction histidine kinase
VVRPILRSAMEDEAELAVRTAAGSLAALPENANPREGMRALRSEGGASNFMLFWIDNREQVGFPPLRPQNVEPLEEVLERGGPRARGSGGPRGGGLRDRPGSGTGSQIPEWGPGGPLREIARAAVASDKGFVIALARTPRFSLLPPGSPRPLFLFLPLALALAGAAGLLLFRGVVHRLRHLEEHSNRVASGNLETRIPDLRADEIGRVAEALNRMTTSLQGARDRVAETDRQRQQLLGDVTHELATPLTSIRGYAETLSDSAVPLTGEERVAYVAHILEEAERMDGMIQDLLALSRLEAGATTLSPELLDWASLLRHTAARFGPRFRSVGLTLELPGLEDPAWVEADGRALEQVAENLLVNTLRHVPTGETVTVRLERGEKEHTLRIEDTGPGVPPEDLPRIFDRFTRSDPSRTTPGSGLGLAIVKSLVEAHGGKIVAENRSPRGLSLLVTLAAKTNP